MKSDETLQQLMQETEARIQDLSEKVAPLLTELETQRERLSLLAQLLNLSKSSATKTQQNGRTTTSSLWDNSVEILRQADQPLHLGAIKSALISRGISIPGKGSDANLIGHLSRCPKIVRVSRGIYGLVERDLESANARIVTLRKKRSKQSTKRKARPAALARRPKSE